MTTGGNSQSEPSITLTDQSQEGGSAEPVPDTEDDRKKRRNDDDGKREIFHMIGFI